MKPATMKPATLKIGTHVKYPTHHTPARYRPGVVDAVSTATGCKLCRVKDRWFEAGSLQILEL